MAPRFRLFRAKCRSKRIDLSQCHGRRFHVKLARLREVRLILEVIYREQRGCALARCRRNDRRISERESALVEKIASRFDDLSAYPQDGCLPLRANPQMPM